MPNVESDDCDIQRDVQKYDDELSAHASDDCFTEEQCDVSANGVVGVLCCILIG